jgi:uncharacterized protein (TIGR02246 family)
MALKLLPLEDEKIARRLSGAGLPKRPLGATTGRRPNPEGLQMDQTQNGSGDEAAVRAVVETWIAAIRRKDMPGILQNHSADLVMFDVPPPFQSRGIQEYRATWDLFFSCSSDPVRFDVTEMAITAGADVAFVVAAMRCAGPGADGEPESLDFRLTIGLRKIDGRWIITHEHHSVPAED